MAVVVLFSLSALVLYRQNQYLKKVALKFGVLFANARSIDEARNIGLQFAFSIDRPIFDFLKSHASEGRVNIVNQDITADQARHFCEKLTCAQLTQLLQDTNNTSDVDGMLLYQAATTASQSRCNK